MKLTIGHLYPDLLNLYGDRGNIQCMMKRSQWRGIEAETIEFTLEDTIDFSKNENETTLESAHPSIVRNIRAFRSTIHRRFLCYRFV